MLGYETIGITASSSPSSSSCFAASETVQLENGDFVSIADNRLGDVVLAADAERFSASAEVVAVPHNARNSIRVEFVQLITTSDGIRLTSDHLITVFKGC
jgi:hypothetical protein